MQTSKVVQKKLKQLQEMQTDSMQMLDALDTLSTLFPAENSTEARRALRGQLERQSLTLSTKFIASFDDVRSRLEQVDSLVEGLHRDCGAVRKRLLDAERTTSEFVGKATRLSAERDTSRARASQLGIFLERYQLSDAELSAVREAPIEDGGGERFFSALERLSSVRAECKLLLDSQHQSVGVELLDATAELQERALARLYRWVQAHCVELELDVPEPAAASLFQRALSSLRQRPAYHSHCCECVCQNRRTLLVRRFGAALTRGDGGAAARPIEMHAHDAQRYVGDMLAWVHQSVASEKEVLLSVCGPDFDATTPLSSSAAVPVASGAVSGDGNGEIALPKRSLLCEIFEGLARPLQLRLQHAVSGLADLVLLYKLSHLVAFYAETLGALLLGAPASAAAAPECSGSETDDAADEDTQDPPKAPAPASVDNGTSSGSSIIDSVRKCRRTALDLFDSQLQTLAQRTGAALQETLLRATGGGTASASDTPTSTLELDLELETGSGRSLSSRALSPSTHVIDQLNRLVELRAVFESSLVNVEPDPAESRMHGVGGEGGSFVPVLDAVLDPLLAAVGSGAEELSSSSAATAAVFRINHLVAARDVLLSWDEASEWRRRIAEKMESAINVLVRAQAEALLKQCGLARVLAIMDEPSQMSASARPGLSEADVTSALASFNDLLFTLAYPFFERVSDVSARETCRAHAATTLRDAFTRIHVMITTPTNGYKAAPRFTPEQVEALLDIPASVS